MVRDDKVSGAYAVLEQQIPEVRYPQMQRPKAAIQL
jgi:hypothetical protein